MTEADLAQALRKRLYMTAPTVALVAVPNGGKRTPWAARQAKKEGLATGFPDIVALWPGGGGAFIELKSATGRVSDNQADWLARLADMGHRAAVCRTVDDAVAFLRGCGAPIRERAA